MHACEIGRGELVKALLVAGADPSAYNRVDMSAQYCSLLQSQQQTLDSVAQTMRLISNVQHNKLCCSTSGQYHDGLWAQSL